jgi:hypothetical protein
MKGITWSRDSHGLFDYESRHLTKKTMKTNLPVQIQRHSNDIDMGPLCALEPSSDQDNRPLLNIINENGKSYHKNSIFVFRKSKNLKSQKLSFFSKMF